MHRFRAVGPSLAVCGLVAGVPVADARAMFCDGCTESGPDSVSAVGTSVDSDGVLVLWLSHLRPGDASPRSWSRVSIQVSDDAGNGIEGQLETHDDMIPAAWRPATALPPGDYVADIVLEREEPCGPREVSIPFVAQPAQPRDPPGWPELALDIEIVETELRGLDDLVCCDGAMPYLAYPMFGDGCSESRGLYDDSRCSAMRQRIFAQISASLPDDAPPRFALREHTQSVYPTGNPKTFVVRTESDACLEFEIVDLVTLEVQPHTWCPDVTLGTSARPEFESDLDDCEGPPYVCEARGDAWQPDRCTLWPDGGSYVPTVDADPQTEETGPSDVDDELDDPARDSARGCTAPEQPSGLAATMLMLLALGATRRANRRR